MFEKVNPSHPDKIADRIAGAVVDLAYELSESPKVAVEVLIGHGVCHIIAETSENIEKTKIDDAVRRIAGDMATDVVVVPQDVHLAGNQRGAIRCGDNGIFTGVPTTAEQRRLSTIARGIYARLPHDGKYILDGKKLVICQSNVSTQAFQEEFPDAIVNPLGDWTGGTDADTGATNRKLGSDMGDAVTGGGLHGKDLSKADVTLNIVAHLLAKACGGRVSCSCSIGDTEAFGMSYSDCVKLAKDYIDSVGGFEKFAEWGLI